jgi:hypothetical protein
MTFKSVVEVKEVVAEKWRVEAVATLDCTLRLGLAIFCSLFNNFLSQSMTKENKIGIRSDQTLLVLSIESSWRKRRSQRSCFPLTFQVLRSAGGILGLHKNIDDLCSVL